MSEAQLCEHDGCDCEAVFQDYCEEHADYYFCECGQRLEDSHGNPGDGFCVRCQ